MNKDYMERVRRAAESIRARYDKTPELLLVLGSGLGGFAERLDSVEVTLDYADIDGFVTSTVEGHRGRLVFGTLAGRRVCLMQGRVHLYEGYTPHDVTLPLRALRLLGTQILFLTNASGGVNFSLSAGDLMLITDQIATFVPSPLRGENLDELGCRFPDMSRIYDRTLCEAVREAAREEDVPLAEGVYLQLPGPQFESPAEIRMARTLGADAVGMSTAVEAVAARHAGMRVVGVSCVCNLACGMRDEPLSHEEVQAAGAAASERFSRLVTRAISKF